MDKWKLCNITNAEGRSGGIAEALVGADMCVALSKNGPDVIKKEWVSKMAKDAIVFACANPIPEMWPWDAKEAGAAIVATGRSDFPTRLTTAWASPGIFRGALDVRARTITDEMCIAAAVEMAKLAEENGLSDEYIMPTMDEVDVFPREAAAVAMKAIEQGVARFTNVSFEQEYQTAKADHFPRPRTGAGCHGNRLHPHARSSTAPKPTEQAVKASINEAGRVRPTRFNIIGFTN